MRTFFFPIKRQKTISTNLAETEIHEKLDKLNYQYKDSKNLLDNRIDHISYFPGNQSFNAERTYSGFRNGTFYITAYGSIDTNSKQTVITIEYLLDNPYLRMFFSIYFGFILFAWLFGIPILINNLKHDGYSVLVFPVVLLFFTIVPFLYRIFFTGDIYTFHSKIVSVLNKKG